MKDAGRMVKVYTAGQVMEAEMFKAVLEDEGITAVVQDEGLEAAGVAQQYRGFGVYVSAEEADKAHAILKRPHGADWACPKCKEKIAGVFDACWKCGYERE